MNRVACRRAFLGTTGPSPVGDDGMPPLLELEADKAMGGAPVESGVRGMGVVDAEELADAMADSGLGVLSVGCIEFRRLRSPYTFFGR